MPAIVKKIFCTIYAASAPATCRRDDRDEHQSVTNVPMFAGSQPFIATPTA